MVLLPDTGLVLQSAAQQVNTINITAPTTETKGNGDPTNRAQFTTAYLVIVICGATALVLCSIAIIIVCCVLKSDHNDSTDGVKKKPSVTTMMEEGDSNATTTSGANHETGGQSSSGGCALPNHPNADDASTPTKQSGPSDSTPKLESPEISFFTQSTSAPPKSSLIDSSTVVNPLLAPASTLSPVASGLGGSVATTSRYSEDGSSSGPGGVVESPPSSVPQRQLEHQ